MIMLCLLVVFGGGNIWEAAPMEDLVKLLVQSQ